jgi:hypothetical protein
MTDQTFLHFGSQSNYYYLIGTYFFKNNNTATIYDINYCPTDLYNTTDGIAGKCWNIKLYENNPHNNTIINRIYLIRDFEDLITIYKKRNYSFINKKEN